MGLPSEEIAGYCLAIMGQPLEKSDSIVALTGDGYGRIIEAGRLYSDRLAPVIMITGADNLLHIEPTLKASHFRNWLFQQGTVTDYEDVIADDLGSSTPGQARNVVAESKKRNWRRIIIVASGDHIVRAYLTFLKAFLKDGYPIRMFAHASYAPWFAEDCNLKVEIRERWARFVKEEYPRIERYQEKGDVATWQELEIYLREQKL